MNKTARQLNDLYKGKLLWITLENGSVITGQFVGQEVLATDDLQKATIWVVENMSSFFTDKSEVPIKKHRTIHPSEIADIVILDWNETGGAKQLADLCGLHLIKIKKPTGDPILGVVIGPFVPEGRYRPFQEGLRIHQLQSLKEYSEFVKYSTTPGGRHRFIPDPKLVRLGEISTIEVLRNQSDAVAIAGT